MLEEGDDDRLPRACGDRSGAQPGGKNVVPVFPASAGIVHTQPQISMKSPCVFLASAGIIPRFLMSLGMKQFSPHTRGSFLSGSRGRCLPAVFPARAGIFLFQPRWASD